MVNRYEGFERSMGEVGVEEAENCDIYNSLKASYMTVPFFCNANNGFR